MLPKTRSALIFIAIVFAVHDVSIAQNSTGTVTGQIRAANGMAAMAVRVAAVPVEGNRAADASISPASITETDASGRYRLANLPIGRYYIVAGLPQTPTYYPGTVDAAGAAVVNIEADTVPDALNFQLQRSGGVRVSGKLMINWSQNDRRSVTLWNITTNETIGQVNVSPEGSFEFVHVLPGSYAITADTIPIQLVWSSRPSGSKAGTWRALILQPVLPSVQAAAPGSKGVAHCIASGCRSTDLPDGPAPESGLKTLAMGRCALHCLLANTVLSPSAFPAHIKCSR